MKVGFILRSKCLQTHKEKITESSLRETKLSLGFVYVWSNEFNMALFRLGAQNYFYTNSALAETHSKEAFTILRSVPA